MNVEMRMSVVSTIPVSRAYVSTLHIVIRPVTVSPTFPFPSSQGLSSTNFLYFHKPMGFRRTSTNAVPLSPKSVKNS